MEEARERWKQTSGARPDMANNERPQTDAGAIARDVAGMAAIVIP
jgi:hypothetical protein